MLLCSFFRLFSASTIVALDLIPVISRFALSLPSLWLRYNPVISRFALSLSLPSFLPPSLPPSSRFCLGFSCGGLCFPDEAAGGHRRGSSRYRRSPSQQRHQLRLPPRPEVVRPPRGPCRKAGENRDGEMFNIYFLRRACFAPVCCGRQSTSFGIGSACQLGVKQEQVYK